MINKIINDMRDDKNIYYFKSLDSTSAWLLENGSCGDICISDEQTKGRGRRGNHWVSQRGNIHFSIRWCFKKIGTHWSLLGLVIGVAVVEALQDIGLDNHGIKWPNDIFWKEKKLGGVLLETTDQSGNVVIGIGINITTPDDSNINQAVTSLQDILGSQGEHESNALRKRIVNHLIIRLHQHFKQFETLDFSQFKETWQTWDVLQGRQIEFDQQGSNIIGEVTGIDKYGRLGIETKTGKVSFYSSADIKLHKKQAIGKP